MITGIVFDKSTDYAKRHLICFYHNIKSNETNICHTDSDLKVHALHYANELFVRVRLSFQKLNNMLNMQKQYNVYVIKQMVNAIARTIELWMHLGGLLSTKEA